MVRLVWRGTRVLLMLMMLLSLVFLMVLRSGLNLRILSLVPGMPLVIFLMRLPRVLMQVKGV